MLIDSILFGWLSAKNLLKINTKAARISKCFSVASQGWWFYIYSRVKLQPFKDYARHHLAWKIEGHFSDVVFRSQKILTKELTLKLWASFIQIHVTKQRWIYQKQPLRGILKWCPEHLRDHPFSTCAKFSEKLTLLTPWYTHVRVRIRGIEMLVFRKILRTY